MVLQKKQANGSISQLEADERERNWRQTDEKNYKQRNEGDGNWRQA